MSIVKKKIQGWSSESGTDYQDFQFQGLSTDTKPVLDIGGGSEFFEIDTGDLYYFDEGNADWLLQPKQESGGGDELYTVPVYVLILKGGSPISGMFGSIIADGEAIQETPDATITRTVSGTTGSNLIMKAGVYHRFDIPVNTKSCSYVPLSSGIDGYFMTGYANQCYMDVTDIESGQISKMARFSSNDILLVTDPDTSCCINADYSAHYD